MDETYLNPLVNTCFRIHGRTKSHGWLSQPPEKPSLPCYVGSARRRVGRGLQASFKPRVGPVVEALGGGLTETRKWLPLESAARWGGGYVGDSAPTVLERSPSSRLHLAGLCCDVDSRSCTNKTHRSLRACGMHLQRPTRRSGRLLLKGFFLFVCTLRALCTFNAVGLLPLDGSQRDGAGCPPSPCRRRRARHGSSV